jgi:hypothetical protein
MTMRAGMRLGRAPEIAKNEASASARGRAAGRRTGGKLRLSGHTGGHSEDFTLRILGEKADNSDVFAFQGDGYLARTGE